MCHRHNLKNKPNIWIHCSLQTKTYDKLGNNIERIWKIPAYFEFKSIWENIFPITKQKLTSVLIDNGKMCANSIVTSMKSLMWKNSCYSLMVASICRVSAFWTNSYWNLTSPHGEHYFFYISAKENIGIIQSGDIIQWVFVLVFGKFDFAKYIISFFCYLSSVIPKHDDNESVISAVSDTMATLIEQTVSIQKHTNVKNCILTSEQSFLERIRIWLYPVIKMVLNQCVPTVLPAQNANECVIARRRIP